MKVMLMMDILGMSTCYMVQKAKDRHRSSLTENRLKEHGKKAGREARTQLFDSSGKEITFTRGQMWFHVLPTEADVEVN